MNRYAGSVVIAILLTGTAASVAHAQAAAPAVDAMSMVAANSITWVDANIPGFAPGMKMAVVHGNPDASEPYTLRLSFPDGYRFPSHWHPQAENLTVLSGTVLLAMGERADDAQLKAYGAGDYLYIPGTKPHFGGAKGSTVIQLHGQGPFAINLAAARP